MCQLHGASTPGGLSGGAHQPSIPWVAHVNLVTELKEACIATVQFFGDLQVGADRAQTDYSDGEHKHYGNPRISHEKTEIEDR